MTITFDRDLGLRRFKNESCSKWGNEVHREYPKGIRNPIFSQNSIVCYLFFLVFLTHFFYFTYLYLLKNSKNFYGVFLYGLKIYQRIIENSRIFIKLRYYIGCYSQPICNNRYNRVDATSIESHNRCNMIDATTDVVSPSKRSHD